MGQENTHREAREEKTDRESSAKNMMDFNDSVIQDYFTTADLHSYVI